jgi:hypothetical protein
MNSSRCTAKRRALIVTEEASDETTTGQTWVALARLRARIVRRPGRWRRNMKRRLVNRAEPDLNKNRLAG